MKVFGILSTILVFANLESLLAQHCPFDGLYTIAIRVKKTGKQASEPGFYLMEKEVFRKDSCKFNSRVDATRFLSEREVRSKLAEDPLSTRSRYLPGYLEKYGNFLKGNRVVLLGMSEIDCMVERGSEYDYLPRQFVIRYTVNGRKMEVDVPAENIFSLCGSAGSWKRIKAIEIEPAND